MNTFFAPGGSKTDYTYAIDQLQAQHPECATVSLVCAWFFDSRGRERLSDLPVDQLSPRRVRADRRRRAGRGSLAGLGTDRTGLSRDHPAPGPAGDDEFRLWRHAERPVDRALHPGLEGARASASSSIRSCSGRRRASRGAAGSPIAPDIDGAATGAVNAFLGSATPAHVHPRHGQPDGRLFGRACSTGPIGG